MIIIDTREINNIWYSDLTGAFPYTAANGNQYLSIFYSFDTNAILIECMRNRTDAEMLRVYMKCYEQLER